MIQLSALLLLMAIFFAVVGFLRGWNRELIATAGIILGLFALFQFDSLLRGVLLAGVAQEQVFLVQAIIFILIVFFAYQTRALGRSRGPDGRDSLQESVLGGLVGFVNGYLVWGSLWYFMDINQYPLSPWVIAPAPGSPSDQARELLPLVILGGGANGDGNLLAIAVIVLFLFVLIVI
ncbi:MAG: CvpA family protein [Anaerolineae bacterium]|nr:CvpA family protein [Anaerolineae bacterium]